MKQVFLLLGMLLACTSVFAAGPNERAYRCGNTYSQTPCPGGKEVETADARSKDQKAQADAANRRTQRLANEMEKSRLQREQREAAQRKAALKEIDKSAAKTVAKDPKAVEQPSKQKKKSKQPENFTAKTPVEPKKKKAEANKQAKADSAVIPLSPGAGNSGNAGR
jgi:hypothetical protein